MSIIIEKVARNVCRILINRPAKRNALNLELIKRLQAAIEEYEQDSRYSVAILCGVGGNFCAGYDVAEIVDRESGMPKLHMIEQALWPLGTNLSNKKIVIACIEGHAAGLGYELALKCDFRVGERDARMGFLNRRFGIPIMNGGTVLLPQLIGQARAFDIVATGRAQLGYEALDYGILNHIADVGCAMGKALSLSRNLAKFRNDCLMNDLNHIKLERENKSVMDSLRKEREDSLSFLRSCGPLEVAKKFLDGELCRHGGTDLGNNIASTTEVTL